MKLVTIASFTSVIGFLGVTCTYAADRHSRDKGEAVREKQEKADIKNFETYVKMNAFSQEKYGADANSRDDVDDAYSDLLRQHREMAYERNISRSSRMWAVQEDRFRLHTGLYDHPLLQEQINSDWAKPGAGRSKFRSKPGGWQGRYNDNFSYRDKAHER